MPKRALIPLKFELVFNYNTFFKVAQSYPHGPKLAQLTVLSGSHGAADVCWVRPVASVAVNVCTASLIRAVCLRQFSEVLCGTWLCQGLHPQPAALWVLKFDLHLSTSNL